MRRRALSSDRRAVVLSRGRKDHADSSASCEARGPQWHTNRWRWLGRGDCWITKKHKDRLRRRREWWASSGQGWGPGWVQTGEQFRNAFECVRCDPDIWLLLSQGCLHSYSWLSDGAASVALTAKWMHAMLWCPNPPSHWGTFIDIPFNTADTFPSHSGLKKNLWKLHMQL